MKCFVLITQEDSGFVATDAVTHVASQGKTIEEAVENLKEALEVHYEGIDPDDIPDNSFVAISTVDITL